MAASVLQEPGWAVVQGASRGIGAALTEAMLARPEILGVIATSRRPTSAAPLQRLQGQFGERLVLQALDVTDEASVRSAGEAIVPRCAGNLRLLINVTGLLHDDTLQPEKRLEELSAAKLARSFEVNAIGPTLVSRYLIPAFAKTGRSVIASLSARVGSISDNRLGGWYGYRASKAAQNMLTKCLSIELARRLPDCICLGLHPGTVDTELSAPFRRANQERFTPAQAAEHLLTVLARATPAQSGCCLAWDGQEIAP